MLNRIYNTTESYSRRVKDLRISYIPNQTKGMFAMEDL